MVLSNAEKYQRGYNYVMKRLEENPELVQEFLEVFELTFTDGEGSFDFGCYDAAVDFSRRVNKETGDV